MASPSMRFARYDFLWAVLDFESERAWLNIGDRWNEMEWLEAYHSAGLVPAEANEEIMASVPPLPKELVGAVSPAEEESRAES